MSMKKITPGDPETRSADLVTGNIEELKRLFPEAVTEGKVDFGVLRQLLGDAVDEEPEKYGLSWHGKRRARALALTPSTGTLRPAPEESVDWDTTQNVFIEGDNLEVLKLLQKSYAGKVKLIYIDPPYNTGKDFVYPDDFRDGIRNYQEITGQVEGGRRVSSNAEASGRFHTDWLNMMYPRLRLARELLQRDGLVCMSIDDHEMHHLRAISDEVFGHESFVGVLTWITTTQPDNIGKARFGLQQNIEYVLVYSKCSRSELPSFTLRSRGNAPKYPHQGKFGACRFEIIERAFEGAYARPTMRFQILGQPPREGKQWQIGETQARDLEARGRVELVDGVVKRAVYPEDEADDASGFVPFWAFLEGVDTSQAGKAELTRLLGSGHGVDTVKPLSLVTEILTHLPANAIVMDFFAGSGTTGHAVLAQNARDEGTRRFVLVQLPEPLDADNPRQRSSAELCNALGKPRTIAEITKERLRRAVVQVREDAPLFTGNVGFRVFKLAESNIHAWEPRPDTLQAALFVGVQNLRDDRTEIDLLTELMLKLSIELSASVETRTIAGKSTQAVAGGVLIACLAPNLSAADVEPLANGIIAWHRELDPAAPDRTDIIVRDSAFADDVAKTNFAAILTQAGISSDRIRSL